MAMCRFAGSGGGRSWLPGGPEITEGGQVIGDIRAPRLVIADGAIFKGNIEMEGE